MKSWIWSRWGALGGLVVGLMLLATSPAEALITRPTPLQLFLDEATMIVTAEVDAIDPDRPSMILKVDKTLKGKAPFTMMPIFLKGDAIAAKAKDSPALLKRVARKLPVVVFINPRDKNLLGFGYTNGTWFGMTGITDEGEVRWQFNHCEPYLRATFKDSTAEMIQTVTDVLAGKRKAPPFNAKEKPGLGPEVEKKEGASLRLPVRDADEFASAFPQLGVIPTVLVGGPLAMLAMLFPSLFGGWRRWLVFLSVAGTNSTLYTLQYFFTEQLAGTWWGSPTVLWTAMTLVDVVGVWWAWRRYVAGVQTGEAGGIPNRVELILLVFMSLIGIGTLGYCKFAGQSFFSPAWLPMVAFTLAMCGGAVYVAFVRLFAQGGSGESGQRATESPAHAGGRGSSDPAAMTAGLAVSGLTNPRLQPGSGSPTRSQSAFSSIIRQGSPVVSTEVVILMGLLLASTALTVVLQPVRAALPKETETSTGANSAVEEPGAKAPQLLWSFRLPAAGAIDSTPAVVGDRVYVSAAHDSAFSPYGAVYCLERGTGKVIWTFSDNKNMKQVFSSPVVVEDKIYLGEGYHQDAQCKIYCLKAEDGSKVWEFQTGSHTESTPFVVDGKVYCGAGDDGLYCLTADKGEKVWNFPSFHIDASPIRVGDRVYAGCGIGDAHKTTALFSLDDKTGQPAWRVNTDLPVWGRPIVAGERVYYATGNGRLNEKADKPAGTVSCLRSSDGEPVWTCKLSDGVLGRLTLGRRHLYFGCQDGYVYSLDRETGTEVWKKALGSPVVSAPVLVRCGTSGVPAALYAIASEGVLQARAPASGRLLWQVDLAERAKSPVEVHSTPTVEVIRKNNGWEGRRIYVAATMTSTGRLGELLCFEDELEPVPGE